MYHITNFQACGLYANVKKKLEKFTSDLPSSCTQIFSDLRIKKMPMDSFKFSNHHEIREFEDHKKTNKHRVSGGRVNISGGGSMEHSE